MTHFLAIGHSHLAGLRRAHREREKAGVSSEATIQFLQLRRPEYEPTMDGNGELHPQIRRELENASVDAVVVALGGNMYNTLGLVNHPQKFDFVLPMRPDLPLNPGAEVLPSGAVRERLSGRMQELIDLLSAIREATEVPVFLFEPPPPVPDEDYIRTHAGGFHDRIVALGVSPATMRYKLWRLQSAILGQACKEHGVEFLNVPPSMQDADGMLAEAAWHTDPTHANAEFGERQYRQLEALAGRIRSMKGASA